VRFGKSTIKKEITPKKKKVFIKKIMGKLRNNKKEIQKVDIEVKKDSK